MYRPRPVVANPAGHQIEWAKAGWIVCDPDVPPELLALRPGPPVVELKGWVHKLHRAIDEYFKWSVNGFHVRRMSDFIETFSYSALFNLVTFTH